MTMKIAAHCHGLGVGSVPRHMIQQELADGRLKELVLDKPMPGASNHIAWKISNRGQALQWLVEQLQNQPPLA